MKVLNKLLHTTPILKQVLHKKTSPLKLIFTHVVSFSVQHECIPQAILGMDILCQAKSGMGKTAVFVLATLQQIEPVDGQVSWLLYYCLIPNAW